MSDSPRPLDFTLAIRSSQGLILLTAKTIQPGEKLTTDLASLITQLGGDPTGAYAQGSVAVYFSGTIMPLVGQISIRNPQYSLSHESEMVENDPGRSDIPPVLNGEWWGLGSGVEAQVFVSNTSDAPQMAEVYLDFQGKRHKLDHALSLVPYETKALDIAQLLSTLGVDPALAPEGGITIIQAGPNPTLIANGKITDPATGFSSTIDFPLPEDERASALHATGLPIGTPTKDSPFAGTGTFTPHVVLRNLLGAAQSATITVEYPQPVPAIGAMSSTPAAVAPVSSGAGDSAATASATGAGHHRIIPAPPLPGDNDHHPEWGAGAGGTVGTVTLASLPVGPYGTVDYSLAVAMSRLPLPLPFCSIRIQYSGAPGSLEAEVSSVEDSTSMVVDARVENEGNGWAGSGANPWHLDKNTESILFLTNEGEKTARIGFVITASGVNYYLNRLVLAPHETRALDIRQLRDAQIADFRENKIPATAEDGSVRWIRIDNVPVMGRLLVIQEKAAMNSSYDCCVSCCPASYFNLEVQPGSFTLNNIGDSQQCYAYGFYQDCNNNQTFPAVSPTWSSSDTSVASVFSGNVTANNYGSATITATYTGNVYDCTNCPNCDLSQYTASSSTSVTVGAYPVNFRQTAGYDAGSGRLHFAYAWDSSTGNVSDLSSCTVNEIVSYPGTADPYYWPTPPWIQGTPNPSITGVSGSIGAAVDDQYTGYFSAPPYAAASFSATQSYTYTCYSAALKGTLMGPLNIDRSVSGNAGTFTYLVNKSGLSASCTVPNCTQGP